MKCPNCGSELQETKSVTYGGKHPYSCIVCGYKGWVGYINMIKLWYI